MTKPTKQQMEEVGTDAADAAAAAGAPNQAPRLTTAVLIRRLEDAAKLMRQGHAVYAPEAVEQAASLLRAVEPLFRKHSPWLEENEKRNAAKVAQRAGSAAPVAPNPLTPTPQE